jgi:NAD(P)-dependent dehydrogenase (short-subunit alcohol dehydrogenase family)
MPTPPEYHIEGKVYVATGAGRGIGRGIAEVLSEAGADGAITALTPTYVLPLAERLSRRSGVSGRGQCRSAGWASCVRSVC